MKRVQMYSKYSKDTTLQTVKSTRSCPPGPLREQVLCAETPASGAVVNLFRKAGIGVNLKHNALNQTF